MPDASKPKSLLGFDYGLKQIGVANGQTLTCSANGLTILKAGDGIPDWAEVEKLLNEWKPDLVVVDFLQRYESDSFSSSRRKHQYWRLEDGAWRIVFDRGNEVCD